jgi:hypothetical protein
VSFAQLVVRCSCAGKYFTDSSCTAGITFATSTAEFMNMCVSSTMPLGSWGTNTVNSTRNANQAFNRSYMFTSCVAPGSKVVFAQYMGTGCTSKNTTTQEFASDGSCLPINVFEDIGKLYVKFTCGAMTAYHLSFPLIVLLGAMWLTAFIH